MGKGSILGYDINNTYCQISYFDSDTEEPVTMETASDNYQVPLVLGYLKGEWIYGREAHSLRLAGEGEMVTDLYDRALNREKIEVGGQMHDAIWLLAKFISLTLEGFDDIDYLTFTVPDIDIEVSKMLQSIAARQGLPADRLYVQDYKESFCFYMFYQPKELWQDESALFSCDDEKIDAYMLRRLNVEPSSGDQMFVTVDEVANADIKEYEILSPMMDPEKVKDADDNFTTFIKSVFEKKVVSSVYLTGEGFTNNWYPNSMKVLCNGRRAFVGNNLYSKGACYTSMCRCGQLKDGPVYLDDTKMTQRISLRMRVDGKDGWVPLVDWGTRWYEGDTELQVILEDTSDIEIHIESLTGEELRVKKVSLEGLPDRKDYSLRIQIEAMFLDEQTLLITFRDVGFGEFYPASDFKTEKTIHLGGIHGQFNSMS